MRARKTYTLSRDNEIYLVYCSFRAWSPATSSLTSLFNSLSFCRSGTRTLPFNFNGTWDGFQEFVADRLPLLSRPRGVFAARIAPSLCSSWTRPSPCSLRSSWPPLLERESAGWSWLWVMDGVAFQGASFRGLLLRVRWGIAGASLVVSGAWRAACRGLYPCSGPRAVFCLLSAFFIKSVY